MANHNGRNYRSLHLRPRHLTGLRGVYLAQAIRNFAIALVGIYIPIYIFKLYYPDISKTLALLAVISYFFLFEFSCLLATIPVGRLVLKLGLKRSAVIGNVLLAVSIGTLMLASQSDLWLIASALADGLSIHFYWNCYHLTVVGRGDHQKFGSAVSNMGIIARLVSVAGPALGGLIIALCGFPVLLSLAFVLILISSLPLARVAADGNYRLAPAKFLLRRSRGEKFRKMFGALAGSNARAAVDVIVWPLFVFLLAAESYVKMGLITSGVLLISVVVVFLVGKLVARGGVRSDRRALTFGVVSESFVWIAKMTIQTLTQVFWWDALANILFSFQFVPFDTIVYEQLAAYPRPYEFIVMRELALRLGGLFGLASLLAVIGLGLPWTAAFVLVALWPLLMLLVVKVGSQDGS